MSAALAPWRKPLAVHDPGKVLLDLAVAVALGGDCLADIALLRAEPGCSARSPPIRRSPGWSTPWPRTRRRRWRRSTPPGPRARRRVWRLAGEHAPDHGVDAAAPLIIDLDATLVTAHSDKEQAAPTFKRGFGFHPLCAFVDHGPSGTGEPLAVLLRPGNAGSNTAADHITVTRQALAQLPGHRPGVRPGRKVLIRTDGGRRHPRVPGLADPAPAVVLGRVRPARRHCRSVLAQIPDRRRGPRPTTPTARSGTAPGSPSSPACST